MADVITRLKVESSEYNQKLGRATIELQRLDEACSKAGKSMNMTDKENVAFAQSLGRMQTQARNARGKLNELNNAFTETSIIYKRLTDEEKNSPFGKALSQSLDQLKGRIREAKAELQDVQKSLGGVGEVKTGGFSDLKGILGEVGGQLGINSNLMQLATTGTLAYGAAVAGVVTAVAAASKAFAEYNSEVAKLDQQTSVILGIKDDGQIAKITDELRAYCKVYGTDFTQAVNAANTLIQQFGISSDEALSILKDGFQGMLPQDASKLLQMIQQFAPSFRDAGISAKQLVAIIHNSEGGIFTDANMNAIVMGIKNIRLMKDTTKESLKSIGVDADAMTQKLNAGTMSVFSALQQVSNAVSKVGSGSQEAGNVMNDIFGKQGVAAGQNLGKAIAQLNTNLEQTKTQTGEVGGSMRILADRTAAFDEACRRAFKVDGWEGLVNELNGRLLNAMTNIVNCIADIEEAVDKCTSVFNGMGDVGEKVFFNIEQAIVRALGPLGRAAELLAIISGDPEPKGQKKGGKRTVYKNQKTGKTYDTREDAVAANGNHYYRANDGKVFKTREEALAHNKKIKANPTKTTTTTTTKTEKEVYNTGEIGDYENKLSELRKAQKHATSTEDYLKIQQEIDATTKKVDELKGKFEALGKTEEATFTIELDESQLKDLKDKLPKDSTVTITENVETGKVEEPKVDAEPVTKVINVEPGKVEEPKVDAEPVTKTYTIKVDDDKAYQQVKQFSALNPQIKADVVIDKKPKDVEVAVGVGGLNTEAFSAYISMLQEQLKKADFGSSLRDSLVKNLADVNILQDVLKKAEENGIYLSQLKVTIPEAELDTTGIDAEISKLQGELTDLQDGVVVGIDESEATERINVITSKIAELEDKKAEISVGVKNFDAENIWSKILDGKKIPQETWQNLQNAINEECANLGIEPIDIKINVNEGSIKKLTSDANAVAAAWRDATSAVSSIGSALQNIKDPTAKVAGIIAEAIANIAGSFASALANSATGKLSTWGWIAEAAAGAATMASTIASIHSATGYATGGTIEEKTAMISHGTDTVPAMLSPGETVLTRAQTGNLASQLDQTASQRNINITGTLDAEVIRLAVDNGNKRRGRGEYVTTKNRRS